MFILKIIYNKSDTCTPMSTSGKYYRTVLDFDGHCNNKQKRSE